MFFCSLPWKYRPINLLKKFLIFWHWQKSWVPCKSGVPRGRGSGDDRRVNLADRGEGAVETIAPLPPPPSFPERYPSLLFLDRTHLLFPKNCVRKMTKLSRLIVISRFTRNVSGGKLAKVAKHVRCTTPISWRRSNSKWGHKIPV